MNVLTVEAMHALGAASVAVVAIPLVFVAWRVVRLPLRGWLPLVLFLTVIFLIQGVDALGGNDLLVAVMYLAAGLGRH